MKQNKKPKQTLESAQYGLDINFKFLSKGVDKATRLSTINDNEKSGLKMTDLEAMVKSLRLAWLKRIFSENDGRWKNYLHHLLKSFGGSFIPGTILDRKNRWSFSHPLLARLPLA